MTKRKRRERGYGQATKTDAQEKKSKDQRKARSRPRRAGKKKHIPVIGFVEKQPLESYLEAPMTSHAPFELNVFARLKDQRSANGLRRNDYARYKKFCTKSLATLRASTGFTAHENSKFVRRDFPLDFDDERVLLVPLLTAERAWAAGSMLKMEYTFTEEPTRKLLRLFLRKYANVVDAAEEFEFQCRRHCTGHTTLEAAAYLRWAQALTMAERAAAHPGEDHLWRAAAEHGTAARRHLRHLFYVCDTRRDPVGLGALVDKLQDVQRILRECAYRLEEDIAEESLPEITQAALDQSSDGIALMRIPWRGFKIPVWDASIVGKLQAIQDDGAASLPNPQELQKITLNDQESNLEWRVALHLPMPSTNEKNERQFVKMRSGIMDNAYGSVHHRIKSLASDIQAFHLRTEFKKVEEAAERAISVFLQNAEVYFPLEQSLLVQLLFFRRLRVVRYNLALSHVVKADHATGAADTALLALTELRSMICESEDDDLESDNGDKDDEYHLRISCPSDRHVVRMLNMCETMVNAARSIAQVAYAFRSQPLEKGRSELLESLPSSIPKIFVDFEKTSCDCFLFDRLNAFYRILEESLHHALPRVKRFISCEKQEELEMDNDAMVTATDFGGDQGSTEPGLVQRALGRFAGLFSGGQQLAEDEEESNEDKSNSKKMDVPEGVDPETRVNGENSDETDSSSDEQQENAPVGYLSRVKTAFWG